MKNYLIYPTKKMFISQSYSGNYSHNKSSEGSPKDFPIDESCGSTGRDYFYCPCDEVVIKRIYGVGQSGTNTIWMESTKKVILANNTESYVTIMVTHPNDDTLKNIKVGDKFTRGEPMFIEGNDGNATGNHFHISVSASKYVSGGWQKNNKGAWVIKGNPIKPEDAFFIDQDFTQILNSRGLTFKNLIKYVTTPVLRDRTKKQIEVIVDELRVRKSPYGEILGYANIGVYDVLEEQIGNDYTWYKIDNDMWIAGNTGVWTLYYDKEVEEDIEIDELSEDIFDTDDNNNSNSDNNDILDNDINDNVNNVLPKKESIWQKIKNFFLTLFRFGR